MFCDLHPSAASQQTCSCCHQLHVALPACLSVCLSTCVFGCLSLCAEYGVYGFSRMQDQENGHLRQLQSLMPAYRARPSLLGPVAAAAGFSLGAAAGLLPTKLSHAITGKSMQQHTQMVDTMLQKNV